MPDYHLGALIRPTDPREQAYAFRLAIPPTGVDLSQPRLLSRYKGVDVRPAIEDQGPLGACASYSAIACSRICAVVAGRVTGAPMLTGDALYEMARKQMGTWPQDSGSYLATNLDLLIAHGAPLESAVPEHHDAAFDYGTAWDQGASDNVWALAHHPFYPTEGSTIENIWTALDAGLPVHVGTAWAQAWFSPVKGVVDGTVTQAQGVGGHAIYIWGITPTHVLFANQWGVGWSADAPSSGLPDMRPGDFAVPVGAFTRADTPFWEFRAVNPRPFTPPKPQPAPDAPFWKWTELAAQYCERTDVTAAMRLAEARTLAQQLKRYYPAVTL